MSEIDWSTKSPLIRYFRRFNTPLGQGLIIAITGSQFSKTGTGKSYSAMKISEEMDKNFGIDRVVYHPRQFLRAMDNIEQHGLASQCVVVDESEVLAPSSAYMSFTNSAISYSMATFRYLRSNAFFCTPTFNWLDKRVRYLCNFWGVSEKTLDEGNKPIVKLKMYRLRTSFFGDKLMAQKIRVKYKGRMMNLKTIKMNLPSPELVEAYEKVSREYKSNYRKEVSKAIEQFEKATSNSGGMSAEELFQKCSEDGKLIEEMTSKKGRITAELILFKFPNMNRKEAIRGKIMLQKAYGR
jgi:hypothetical protein